MSVINKMLRDLDSRQASVANPTPARQSPAGLARGTLSVNDSEQTGSQRDWPRNAVRLTALVVLLATISGGWWILNQSRLAPRDVTQPGIAATSPASTPTIVVAPRAAAPVQPIAMEPVTMASPARVAADKANRTPMADMVATPVVAKLPAAQSGAAQAAITLKMDNSFKSAPRVDTTSRSKAAGIADAVPERPLNTSPPNQLRSNERPVISAASVPAAATPVAQTVPRQSPALEALAQAQSLWSAGSHEAAMELVREALAVAERANSGGTPAGNLSVLASLARELARMELAQGRASQALEVLTRLEPALSGFADVWAMRGNAAQRLGRHQESAAAYLAALKLRPDEPRWMLGAAVSLAAQGQTAGAAELAEKARAGGVLSREVASYLRQLGVPLRER